MNDTPPRSRNAAEDLWKNRVSEEAVARILGLMAAAPNRHEVRLDGDLVGHFDYWFDGGACVEVTGWNRFEFQDGTVADVGSCNQIP